MQVDPSPEVTSPGEMPATLREVSVDDFLAQMAQSQGGEEGPQGGRYLATGGVRPRPKIRYSHEAMCDLILMDPSISQNKLAAVFGYTPGWVSTVITSDAFQSLLARRRAEVVNPEICLGLSERAKAVAVRSMQVLQDKLAKPSDQVPDALALRALEISSKALGMGGNAPPPPPPNPAEYLPQLAERLMRLQGRSSAEDAVIINPET